MSTEEEHLYTRYYYNAVIEFIYFTTLYLEVCGTTSLSNLIKHVKFFKKEVTDFISSFEGKNFEDKFFQVLNMLDCFHLYENRIKLNAKYLKNGYLEDLVLSKCVDLILKGITKVEDICKILNDNSVVIISKSDLQDIIDRNTYISMVNGETARLEHAHGMLGFDDNLYNSVINYFYEILFRGQILSVKEIKNHGRLLKFCGLRNVMVILSILKCSDKFVCQDGFVLINRKSKRHQKKKLIDFERMESKFLSRSLSVSQIVFSIYGGFLYKWSGEIGDLTETSGNIYCVVDFKNGEQGVFNICFNIAALTIISDIGSLRNYLSMRDIVEFDAEYYSGKLLDRCWRATRVKVLSSKKFEHDETLMYKLTKDTDVYRDKCVDCYSTANLPSVAHKPKFQKQASCKIKTSDYDSLSDSLSEVDTANGCVKRAQDVKFISFESLTNLAMPKYVIMFGYVHVLMEDKVIAIAKHGHEVYNILIVKDSAYVQYDRVNVFTKGQKVVALVPYIEKLETLCVATLVYGLSSRETEETDKSGILPVEFADKIFFKNTVKSLCDKFCVNHYKIFSNEMLMERFMANLKLKIEISDLYSFIKSQYEIKSENHMLQFLYSISKTNPNDLSCDSKVFNFVVKLSKYLAKHSVQNTSRNERKSNIKGKPDLESDTSPAEYCANALAITITDENNVTKTNLNQKYNSLDLVQDSMTSSNSFKTCSSNDSIESFYSCEYKSISNCLSDSSNNEVNSNYSDSQLLHTDVRSDSELDDKENNDLGPFNEPYRFEIKVQDISDDTDMSTKPSQLKLDIQSKNSKKFPKSTKDYKYLSLQSVPCLKSQVKKKKSIALPYFLRSLCINCSKNALEAKAHISMITNEFFFLTAEIEGRNVILPLSKQNIPPSFLEKMKLNSCCEITIIPTIILNVSHVLEAKLVI